MFHLPRSPLVSVETEVQCHQCHLANLVRRVETLTPPCNITHLHLIYKTMIHFRKVYSAYFNLNSLR